jgi:D-serine deaminase-like pyridoxal phosphate-dependent protein
MTGYGLVRELSDAIVYEVNEEHGYVDISGLARKPKVGDVVRVMPNHVCPINNLFDKAVLVRGAEVLGAARVEARGAVQ